MKKKMKKESQNENKKNMNVQKLQNILTIMKYFYIYVFCSPNNRQNIFRIDARWSEESSQKKNIPAFVNSTQEIHVYIYFPFCLLSPDHQTDDQNIYRIEAHSWG